MLNECQNVERGVYLLMLPYIQCADHNPKFSVTQVCYKHESRSPMLLLKTYHFLDLKYSILCMHKHMANVREKLK